MVVLFQHDRRDLFLNAKLTFERYELKYLLNPAQLRAVLHALEGPMHPDCYGEVTIRNIYFDTADYRLIRRSLEKPAYKEKLRLRSYRPAQGGDAIFVELKKKYRDVVYKRRLALLPAIVCVVILMVNGNVGTGVAVAGAFSLVRFRSVPGTAREIGAIFLAMATGLVLGMGYLAFGCLIAPVLGGAGVAYTLLNLGGRAPRHQLLHITIPEDLNYQGVFDDILQRYAAQYQLTQVKTTNLGSLFRLTYQLTLRPNAGEKALIDDLRCRNGNLEITLCSQETPLAEL